MCEGAEGGEEPPSVVCSSGVPVAAGHPLWLCSAGLPAGPLSQCLGRCHELLPTIPLVSCHLLPAHPPGSQHDVCACQPGLDSGEQNCLPRVINH